MPSSICLLLLRRRFGDGIPTCSIAVMAFLSAPAYQVGCAKLNYWLNERKAARLGAALSPRWDDKLIGNWDIMQLLDKAYFEGL
jgi:hypothetical protein